MAFIDGQPLDRMISEGKLKDLRRIAEIIRKSARGLQKAHEQGRQGRSWTASWWRSTRRVGRICGNYCGGMA
jgi:hypothetical protein